jgi:signal transduction histidine kinase
MSIARRFREASLAGRLIALAALLSLVILLAAGAILYTVQQQAIERGFDERLGVYVKEIVADIAAPTEGERQQIGDLGEPRFDLPLSGWYWQVTRVDGERPLIRASRSLVGGQLPRLADLGVADERGVRRTYTIGPDDRQLRQFERSIDAGEDGRYLIAVAAPADEIGEDIRDFRLALVITLGLLFLALIASTLFQVQLGLKPLARLRAAVGEVRTGEAQRIDGAYPVDIAPLAGELNQLIEANREILDRARTHVGNLAHALKTPLSVIVNEADSTQAAAPEAPLAAKVQEQAALMRDQVNYYLDRARAAALSGALGGVCPVQPSLEALLRTFQKIHRDKGVDARLELPPDARFRGEKQDFEEMMGNLLDNAFKWTDDAVTVSAEVFEQGGRRWLELIVDDNGPGLPADARTDVLKRGRRLDEAKPGSGLGLSIVHDLARLYGGRLTLDDAPGDGQAGSGGDGGLRARLLLPAV